MQKEKLRRRLLYALLVIVLIMLGILSRRYSYIFPAILSQNLGDILWAAMIYFGFAFLIPVKPKILKAAWAMGLAALIEFTQLYHAPWLDNIRHTFAGHLVLGDVFSWGDIFSYFLGVVLGWLMDRVIERTIRN